jgi:hypothetical protein
MAEIIIRDIPDEQADALRRKAAAAGQSLQKYMLGIVAREARRVDQAELSRRVRERARRTAVTHEDIIDALHADRKAV